MNSEDKKRISAQAALDYVNPGSVIGVGTGSTVNHFIDLLARNMPGEIRAAVSSSEASSARLEKRGISVIDLNDSDRLSIYVDGTDESNHQLHLIKGGGGALTREKIIAAASDQFICIADDSKLVETLGKFPLRLDVTTRVQPHKSRPIRQTLSKLQVCFGEQANVDIVAHIAWCGDLRCLAPIPRADQVIREPRFLERSKGIWDCKLAKAKTFSYCIVFH